MGMRLTAMDTLALMYGRSSHRELRDQQPRGRAVRRSDLAPATYETIRSLPPELLLTTIEFIQKREVVP
jgi:hypothetical protein